MRLDHRGCALAVRMFFGGIAVMAIGALLSEADDPAAVDFGGDE